MAQQLLGAPVAAKLCERTTQTVDALKQKGKTVGLAIVRVGEKPDDIYYERSAVKRCENVGINVKLITLDGSISQPDMLAQIKSVNDDDSIHGVLLLRPLPRHLDEDEICKALCTSKDIDGITDGSLAGVFTGKDIGFAPCTARACIEMLDFYDVDTVGKKAVVVGRSLVVGKPVAMMLTARNSTVTICHTRTKDMAAECRSADILIVSAGRAGVVGAEHLKPGQVVIDVGINVDEDGNLCGDVKNDAAAALELCYTPVPRGVGAVTTAVLAMQVADAAQRFYS